MPRNAYVLVTLLVLFGGCSPSAANKLGKLRREVIDGYHAPKTGEDDSTATGPYICETEDVCAQSDEHTDNFESFCFDQKGKISSGLCAQKKKFCTLTDSEGTYVFYADLAHSKLCDHWQENSNYTEDPEGTSMELPTPMPTPTPYIPTPEPSVEGEPSGTPDPSASPKPTATSTPEPTPTFAQDIVSDLEYRAFDECIVNKKDYLSRLETQDYDDDQQIEIRDCFSKDPYKVDIKQMRDKRLYVDTPTPRKDRMANLVRRYRFLDLHCAHDIKVVSGITAAAQSHSNAMFTQNSLTVDAGGHDGTPADRLKTWLPGKSPQLVDEVRYGARAPEFFMIKIKNDPALKAIVGNCNFDSFGVGFYERDGKGYWTIDFAKLK